MNRAILCAILSILVVNIVTAQSNAKTKSGAKAEALKAEVVKAEDAYNESRFRQDLVTLDRILADNFFECNQWRHSHDKKDQIDVVRRIPLSEPWVFTHVNVRVLGDIAFVDGVQSGGSEFHFQASKGPTDKFLFMRNYVRRQGRWQLLMSSLSFVYDVDLKILDPDSLYR